MGLHDSVLDVPERLRIWHLAGVRYFYLDPEADEAAVAHEQAANQEPQVVEAAPPSPTRIVVRDDPATWPDPWPAIFAKAPTRPLLVITYPALGLDMTGRPDPRRGPMWRRLLQDCGLAGKNFVAFWPLNLPDSPDLERDKAIFLAGIRLFRPRTVAFFHDSATTLPLDLDSLPSEMKIVSLPDPDTLLQSDKEVWDAVVASFAAL